LWNKQTAKVLPSAAAGRHGKFEPDKAHYPIPNFFWPVVFL